ncbi:MAG: serine/threonine-protein phosphatase [Thermoleophilaceae bacterium]|nr:serine/threonine-protein phosphatase [Thermoleophilaceae bacterium]
MVALLVGVFGLRAAVRDPVIGIGLLYVVPVIAAAVWFGPWGGVGVGVAGTGLYTLGDLVAPQDHLLSSILLRLVVLCSVGYAFGVRVGRERHARSELAHQEGELAELRALRSALVPPDVPDRPEIELATCFVPAQERVAGDFFVVNEGPDDSTVVVVGDVVGKGLEAARRAAFVRAAFAAYAPYNDDPCRLLELANAALVERAGASDEFVTAACVVYRPADHSISWALAGHPPPMLLDDGERLNGISPGLPLGLDERVECSRADRPLDAGDGVLLFTDGLTEARRPFSDVVAAGRARERPHPELFGSDRIAGVLAEHAGEEPGDVVRALRTAAERFTGGGLADDLCMVAVRARS